MRVKLAPAVAIRLVVTNLVLGREPLYGLGEWAARCDPAQCRGVLHRREPGRGGVPRPQRLRIARAPNPHVAFGDGPHFCLGAHLARLQMQALFAEVHARTAEISYAGGPAYPRSTFQRGVSGCPCAAGAGVVDREHGLLTVTAESGAPASSGWSGVVTGRDLQHRGRRGASDVPQGPRAPGPGWV